MTKNEYIGAVKDLKKSIDDFGKSKSDTPTKLKVWTDYYQRAARIGVSNNFIDNKVRLQLNKLNKKYGGLNALDGESNELNLIKQGLTLILNTTVSENTMKKVNEKAVSKNQQQFMGMVHGLQKGTIDPKDVSADVEKAAASMSKKDATDFASTKHKGLPTRVKNEIVRRLREYGTVDDRHHAQEPNYENFPQSWLMGRGSSANEPKIYDKDRDYGDTNFRKKDSGQEDLDEGISDLIGNQYEFTVGSGTTMNQKPNTKEYVIEQITHAISHYLFDWDFYYNWTDRTEQKEYAEIFKNDILNPLLKNVDKTLNTYFIVDTNRKTVKWKLSHKNSQTFIDEFFRKNKHISKKLKQDYYEYRDEYAGVQLKESNTEDKNGFVDNATSSQAWLMGREGRKFKAATYDKEGTYDDENFVAKNSGQPDLEEDATFQLRTFANLIPSDATLDKKRSDHLTADLLKTLNDFYKRNNINRKIV